MGNGNTADESRALMDNYPVRQLAPFMLLSVLLHGMLLFGIHTRKPGAAKAIPLRLEVKLQELPKDFGLQEQGATGPSSRSAAARVISRTLPNEVAAASSGEANHDLAQDALALAGRLAYADSQNERKEEARQLSAFAGAYRGTYSGDDGRSGLIRGLDYGEFRLNVDDRGEIRDCSIVSNALGKIACSGAVDVTGNMSIFATHSDLIEVKLAGRVSSTPTPRFSGTWTAMHLPTGYAFKGAFSGHKVTIQSLSDL